MPIIIIIIKKKIAKWLSVWLLCKNVLMPKALVLAQQSALVLTAVGPFGGLVRSFSSRNISVLIFSHFAWLVSTQGIFLGQLRG